MRRGANLRLAAQDDDISEAVASAAPVPESVTPEDFSKFMSILNSESVEDLEKRTSELVQAGELTEGVVEAAFVTLEQAKEREGEDPRIIASLEGLARFLFDTIQQINQPPALRLVDGFIKLIKPDVEDAVNEETVREAMRSALTADDAPVGVDEFVGSVKGFLDSMREQDVEFAAKYQELMDEGSPEQKEQLEQLTTMRATAFEQMQMMLRIAESM